MRVSREIVRVYACKGEGRGRDFAPMKTETISNELLFDLAPNGKGFLTEDQLTELLPHGSGIDCKWTFASIRDGIDCFNSFHMMDENGGYCGYADFRVRLFHHKKDVFNPLKGPSSGKVQVVHRKGDVDFKVMTSGNAWRRNAAYGLADDIHEQVSHALRDVLTNRRETIDGTSV